MPFLFPSSSFTRLFVYSSLWHTFSHFPCWMRGNFRIYCHWWMLLRHFYFSFMFLLKMRWRANLWCVTLPHISLSLTLFSSFSSSRYSLRYIIYFHFLCWLFAWGAHFTLSIVNWWKGIEKRRGGRRVKRKKKNLSCWLLCCNFLYILIPFHVSIY